MSSQLSCSICTKAMKSAIIYQCDHIFCTLCNNNNSKCTLCDDSSPNFVTEPDISELQLQWSTQKESKHSPLRTNYQSQTKRKLEYSNIINNTHKDVHVVQQPQTSALLCKKHDDVISFYQTNTKTLLCPSCIYYNKKSNSLHGNNFIPLKNSVQSLKIEVKHNLDQFVEYNNKIEDCLRLCRQAKNIIDNNFQSILDEITNVCDSMVKEIKIKQKQIKNKVLEYLNKKAEAYSAQDQELTKFKDYIKEIRNVSSGFAKKHDKIDDLAYLFEASKQLKKALTNLKLDCKTFTISDLNIFKYNKKYFEQYLNQILKTVLTEERLNEPRPSLVQHRSVSKQQLKRYSRSINLKQKQYKNVSYTNLIKQKRNG